MKPLLSIWISPVKTFELLLTRDDSENRQCAIILSALITIGVGGHQLKDFLLLFQGYKIVGLTIGIILLGIIGIVVIRFLLPLTYWALGKILNGKASKNQIQLVVAYSLTPYLIYLAIALILIVPAIITQDLDLVFYRHPFTYYVVWFLALRNLIYGLSYFNKFSYGYALINILIPVGVGELIRLI